MIAHDAAATASGSLRRQASGAVLGACAEDGEKLLEIPGGGGEP